MLESLSKSLVGKFPNLRNDLDSAGMTINPVEYLRKVIILTMMSSGGLAIALFLILLKSGNLSLIFLVIPLFFIVFFMLINRPKGLAKKRINDIDSEIVFAGRHLLVEMSAGVPLFNALVSVSKAYKKIGVHIGEIIKKTEVGKPLDIAINEVIETTPSVNFRKMMWQILNALRTGGDVSQALESITEQISKEQLIALKTYEKKLNPLVMFYLMIAIIMPSLGISMLSLLSTFLGITLGGGTLIAIVVFLIIVQYFFMSMIRSSRPGVTV